ncbi:MAG: hypothetical protein Q7R68_10880 [Nitrospirales bacterium]|nr:hypothetical protein [Nitrospirales bacterium]
MRRPRPTAPGRLTNYEMAGLRENPPPRRFPDGGRCRWTYMWASVCDPFHPRSQQEWNERP